MKEENMAEHKCRYCGVITTQPDEMCYRAFVEMKREIKFRAWDRDMGEMVFISGIQFDPHSPMETPNVIDQRNDIRDLIDVDLMQYTGLKDKNGKEIYEGDVVTHLHSADTCVVIFQKTTAMFLARGIGDEQMGFGAEYITEVIGNIYENPNLL